MKTTGPDKIYTEIKKEATNNGFTYQDRISTIITTLQNPIVTASESIDIIYKIQDLYFSIICFLII